MALFTTASRPFSADWIETQRRAAERASITNDNLDDKIQLTPISGHFVGWTPYKLGRDYVYPELFEKRTTHAFVSFVVLGNRSQEDGKFVIVCVHPDSYKGKPLELKRRCGWTWSLPSKCPSSSMTAIKASWRVARRSPTITMPDETPLRPEPLMRQ